MQNNDCARLLTGGRWREVCVVRGAGQRATGEEGGLSNTCITGVGNVAYGDWKILFTACSTYLLFSLHGERVVLKYVVMLVQREGGCDLRLRGSVARCRKCCLRVGRS